MCYRRVLVRETKFRRIALLIFLWALPGYSVQRGRLLAVRAGGDGTTSIVELVGDRPLSFTTLRLSGPPRVVVDFADTELSGAPAELSVEDGTVRRVGSLQASSRTARVVIELAGEAEFEVRAKGSVLEVRMLRLAPLLAAAEPEPPPALVTAPRERETTAKTPSAPLPAPEEVVERERAARPEPEAAERRASAEKPQIPAQEPPQAPVEPAQAPVEPPQAPLEPAQAPVERPPVLVARADPARPVPSEAEKRASLPTVALVGPTQHRAPPLEPEQPQRPPVVAPEPAPAPERAAPPVLSSVERKQRPVASLQRRFTITGIGFRQIGAGVVVVRSDRPIEYGVSGEDRAVVLHLPAGHIPMANNRLPLDLSFFDGPVRRVVPIQTAAGVDLRIELREHAEYQLEQAGSVLTLTFQKP